MKTGFWRHRRNTLFIAFVVVSTLSLTTAQALVTNVSSVLDGAGSRSSGGTLTNISAVAQPGGVIVSSGGNLVNYAGFLNTFSLQPNLDTDGDGLADEVDPDNDNDMLADVDELNGSGFSPTTVTDLNDPDSDNDGIVDGEESIAGTDPTDGDALLEIVKVEQSGDDVHVTYRSRQDKNYAIRSTEPQYDDRPATLEGNDVGNAGTGPFQVSTNMFVDTGGTLGDGKFYSVEALKDP